MINQDRDYQTYAIESIFRYYQDGNSGNCIVAMPTGTGKSHVIAGFLKKTFTLYRNQRVIKLTHVKELIEQNYNKLIALWPMAPAGIYSAGLKRRDVHFPIIFAGIASVRNIASRFGHVDLVLIDECHLVSQDNNTMYQKFISELKQVNPYLKVIGFTATCFRMKQGLLTTEGLFDAVAVDMTGLNEFNWFVEEGYLCPLIPRATKNTLDVDNVEIIGGEFNLKDLQRAVDRDEITAAAIDEAIILAQNRNKWLVFGSGIEHAEHITEILNGSGIPAACVHSKITTEERDRRRLGFERGEFRALVNNGVFTTGYDYPGIDCIVMLRPTRSPGLWVQMLGRGTRTNYASGFDLTTKAGRLEAIASSDKKNCLVLDFAGNTSRLGPINDPSIPKPRQKRGSGTAPVKECPECGCYNHSRVRICEFCGNEFKLEVYIEEYASNQELIAAADIDIPMIDTFPVTRIICRKHTKAGRPPSLHVTFYSDLRAFSTYVCFEHTGYALHKAHDWWRNLALTDKPTPTSVDEALTRLDELAQIKTIRVWHNKKYPEILGYG